MRHTIFLAMIAVSGCGRADNQFEHAAVRANAAIVAMRPQVGILLSSTSDDLHVVDACKQAIDASQPLRNGDLGDTETGSNARLSVEEIAGMLQDERNVQCAPDDGDGKRTSRCVTWCREIFRELVEAVDRAHDRAAQKHVSLQQLR